MSDLDFPNIQVQPATWQQDQQQLSEIRHRVFVDEQQVPIEIEIDEQDPTCRHWLALDAEGRHIGTARLEASGKVGRMAVLASHRGRGVGSALLRRIILDASRDGIARLSLNAQTHAIAFYAQFGFVAAGDEFLEAGIGHIKMVLALPGQRHR